MRNTAMQVLLLALAARGGDELNAQLSNTPPQAIAGARMPALSPDGKQIAFVYRGDIWLAPVKGGRAAALTQHVESDAYPVFSPDGAWVAFASRRNGNWDIYAVPATGGTARQLTWHAGHDVPQGWSPDGRRLLFSGKRDTPNFTVYALDVSTLRTEVLCEDYAQMLYPTYSPNGKQVVYGRYGFHWTRPRYHGSAAAQIWILDIAARTRRPLTTNGAQHLWTRFMPGGKQLVTITTGEETPSSGPLSAGRSRLEDNPDRTPNLWLVELSGKARRLTDFVGGSVRCPTVASKSGDIAFEYGPDLWLMRHGKGKPDKLELFAAADEKQTTRRREKLANGVAEAEPAPDGRTIAFGLRGDIWTIPVEKPKGVAGRNADLARRLTEWAGDDSDFSWSRDGKMLFFTSDREFNTRIYQLDLESLEVKSLWDRSENVSGLRVSPDGKQVGFWVAGTDGGLHVLTLKNGDVRRIVKVPGPHWRGLGGGDFAWSPDLKWIAYTARGVSRAWNIWIVPAEGGESINVTRLYAHHGQPAWAPDGKYLFFQSNRDGEGLYVLPLVREIVRTTDTDLKFERSTNEVSVTIEFEDASRRIRKLASQSPQGDLTVTAEGLVVFLSESDLWSVTYDGKETKRLTTGGGKSQLRVSKDGKKAFFVQNGELWAIGLEGRPAEKIAFTAEWERDIRAERRAAFTQFWNAYNRGFYDPNFHGRDWAAIRRSYEPLLEAVETPDEFATLLHMMVGELETSHAEVNPPTATPPATVTPALGFALDYGYGGPGLRIASVPREAPGSFKKTALKAGEYVLTINGKEVAANENLYQLINDRQDREFEFLVNTNANRKGARTVKYKALTPQEWDDLNYRQRIDRLRKRVEQETDGRTAYLHLAAMQMGNQLQFEREAYEQVAGKESLIIDVRFNNGGNIADTLIDWLERKPHGYVRPRDSEKETSPYHAWEKKIIVLMNEHSYSNGEIFPYAMRARGLATLVGMPTPGYVIWTGDLQLVDGTKARMPQSGFYRLDGSTQENNGEKPDVVVPMTPEDWLAGRDPQLDKAIELLKAGR